MKKLEEAAKALLAKHPSKDGVYMTEDGQGFWNKDAAENHRRERGLKKVYPFFRSGVATPQETADAVQALEAANEEIVVLRSRFEIIEKVLTEDEHGIVVTPETDPTVALLIAAKEQLVEAKELANEAETLKEQLTEKETALTEAQSQIAANVDAIETSAKENSSLQDTLKAKDSEIAKLKKELAAATKTK